MLNQPGNKPIRYSFCCSSFMYNNYQNSRDRTLIIDTREVQTYNNRHIAGSINLTKERLEEVLKNKPTTSEEFKPDLNDVINALKQDEITKFSNRRRCFCFLIMNENSLPKRLVNEIKRLGNKTDDEDTFQLVERVVKEAFDAVSEEMEEKESIMSAMELFRVLQQDRVREMFLLLDGAESFFARYPYMSTTTDSSSSTPHSVEHDFPHDILDGRLFLGSFNQSEKYCLVSNLKITHILNMTYECDNVHEDKGINYLKVSILDEADVNISTHFEAAFQFIHNALAQNENNRVLVHCAMGKSRSATMVIMYLMKRYLWSFDKTLSIVKRKRAIVCPNEGFTQQLQSFESQNLNFVNTISQK